MLYNREREQCWCTKILSDSFHFPLITGNIRMGRIRDVCRWLSCIICETCSLLFLRSQDWYRDMLSHWNILVSLRFSTFASLVHVSFLLFNLRQSGTRPEPRVTWSICYFHPNFSLPDLHSSQLVMKKSGSSCKLSWSNLPPKLCTYTHLFPVYHQRNLWGTYAGKQPASCLF